METNPPVPGGAPAPDTKAEIETLKKQAATFQQQLTDVEKTLAKGFELSKWGMGMFITFAIFFAGFNWWTGKTNYERDRESSKQQADLLEQRLVRCQVVRHSYSSSRFLLDFATLTARVNTRFPAGQLLIT